MNESEHSRGRILVVIGALAVGVFVALFFASDRGEAPGVEDVAGTMGAVATPEGSRPEPTVATGSEVGSPSAPPPRVLRDIDGDPLSLDRQEDILTFLRQARVVESKPLNIGVTGAEILTLELGGLRLRGVFHDIQVQKTGPTRLADGKVTMYFVDSYLSQVAAYELARLMGLQRVPPTVQRIVDGERGSVQLWIEDGTDWQDVQEDDSEVPDRTYLRRQMYDLRVFDNLIHNTDRNQGNILFDPDWNLWWIDNTRTFARFKELVAPDLVQRCSRELWRALHSLDRKTAREGLREVLSTYQIKALFARRDLLVDLLEKKIAKLGEDKVLFDYGDPPEVAVKVTYEDAPDGP